MSLLRMVASSSAFFLLPLSPPANGSSIDSDWSTRNRKQPGFLRLISAWYAMVVLHFSGRACVRVVFSRHVSDFFARGAGDRIREPCTLFVGAKAGCDCCHL